ncbi:MAG: hypothetical protein RQ952_01165 [Thermoproteota archaeon]|jgi:hypothetical protein|nr:hypothetical protein [Thermoproteota archaeon]
MSEEKQTLAELTLNPLFAFLLEVAKMALGTGWSANLNLAVSLYLGEAKLGTLRFEGDAKIKPFKEG